LYVFNINNNIGFNNDVDHPEEGESLEGDVTHLVAFVSKFFLANKTSLITCRGEVVLDCVPNKAGDSITLLLETGNKP
jgi:hypothetical protein